MGRPEARWLLFSSADLWRHGGFAHGGLLWAPAGLDHDGMVIKLLFGGGVYRYTSGALGNADVRGEQLAAAILPGWRLVANGAAVTFFLGFDVQNHRLSPNDPSASLRGDHLGARAGAELWYEPTPTTMIEADASYSTIGSSYNARLAGGVRVFDSFYAGPDTQAFAVDGNYRQVRAGLHITGLKMHGFEWSAGAGWAIDNDDRQSAYGKFGVFTRR